MTVHIQAKQDFSTYQSSLEVNQQEWLTSISYGLFVQTFTKTGADGFETKIKRFYKNMAPSFFFESRTRNRAKFIRYFTSNESIVKNGTVIVFVTSGLCSRNSFGNWLEYLKSAPNTGLIFERKYKGAWNAAVVTACKGRCPDGFQPRSIFSYNAALNVTIDFGSRFSFFFLFLFCSFKKSY